MDLDKLKEKYPYVSQEELDQIQATSHYPVFSEICFEHRVSSLHEKREDEILHGKESVLVGPLVQVASVKFLSDQKKSFSIYGRIYVEFCDTNSGETIVHDLYSRKRGDTQVLESNDRLSLINQDCSRWPFNTGMPLNYSKLVVDLDVEDKNLFAQFQCGNDVADMEKVREECIHCDFGTLVLCYHVIPFAVRGRVEVCFSRKKGFTNGDPSLNVKGVIVARSSDSFGGYTLFEKKSNEFERVEFDVETMYAWMTLSRCWVGISAHSSLFIDVDLSEYGTERKILKESIELQPQKTYDKFIVDDFLINVSVEWFSPMPHGKCFNDESSGDEISPALSSEEESEDEQMSEACNPIVSSDLSCRPWQLRPHKDIPLSSCALQIFSVFIGREMFRALQIYGSIKVSAPPRSYYIFNKEASDAYDLVEHSKTMPVQSGCGPYDDSETLKIELDLKDLNSDLRIRGHLTWHWSSFDVSRKRIDKQLCSVVKGEHGFAAIHYSLFSEAIQARIQVVCKPRNEHVQISPPKVFGSLVARYNNYDYTPHYNKDYYRVFLFEKNQEDPTQIGIGGMITLARHVVIVPLGSSLVIEADLFDAVSSEGFSSTVEFSMGSSNPMVLEGESYCIYLHAKWEQVSN